MSSDDSDDEYIIYGQLLDPIQEDEIVKRKDAEQQFVKDENGRRRFHGAFTGGFSAGFYNTVGSLEGWTPSTFKSSRGLKSTVKTQNVYDFMDEEDKKDLGIDSSSLKIKAEYSGQSSRKRQLPEVNTGPIPGKPVLGEFLKPIKDTWGVELLKSMGWRPGQGVGPQLTQREKLRTKKELENVGMKFSTNTKHDDDDDEVNELLENIKVSPYEYESVAIKPKVDTFGLDYKGLQTTNVSVKSTDKYSKLTVQGKSIHGQAFGVGAYEDDDDDIYATDNMSNYDFSLEDKSQKTKNKSKSTNSNTECLDGFIEDETINYLFEKIPTPPSVPSDWTPRGIFERIVGNCPPDFFSQSFNSFNIPNVNVNTRKREFVKSKSPVKQIIKKDVPSLLSNIISDRFTRAVLPDDSTNALIPVTRTTDLTLQRLKGFADKKMYGFWTRKTELWIPDKLLCKRFNVPVPKQSIINYTDDGKKQGECSHFDSLEFSSYNAVPDNENQILNNSKQSNNSIDESKPKKLNIFGSIEMSLVPETTAENLISNTLPLAPEDIKPDPNEQCETTSNETASDTTNCQKPVIDFYKAIFSDSSDDEISVDSVEIPIKSNEKNISLIENLTVNNKIPEPNTSKVSSYDRFAPPKGIFTDIMFNDLFNTCNQVQIDLSSNKTYGPSLPEDNKLSTHSVSMKSIKNEFLEEDEWVEKSESSNNESSHKNKHSKHKKHKKHKNKHKSKKKSHKH